MYRSFAIVFVVAGNLLDTNALAQSSGGPLPDFMPSQGAPYYTSIEFVGESVTNLKGGIDTGTAYNSVLLASFAMNSPEVGMPEGGRLRVSAVAIASEEPSASLIGDAQVASNIEAAPDSRLYDAWFRQDFHNLPLRLHAGIIDTNEFFNVTESSATLLNSSFGLDAALAANAPFSTYPKPGYGVMARFDNESTSIQLGIFQGNPQSRSSLSSAGQLSIAEWRLRTGIDTKFKIGGWQCNCPSVQNNGYRDTTRGVYGSMESTFRVADDRAFSLFLRAGSSSGADTVVPHSFALGVSYPSIIASRPDDEFSAGMTRAYAQDDPAETSYEITYVWQINQYLGIQPDFQYITNPGGNLPDAWVFILRLNVFQLRRFE